MSQSPFQNYPPQDPNQPGQGSAYPQQDPAYYQQLPPQMPGQYPAGPVPPAGRKGMAIASLVLGILALLGSWIPLLNFGSILFAIVGAILGIVALARHLGGRGMAIAGVILSVISLIVAVLFVFLWGSAFNSVSEAIDSATVYSSTDQADGSEATTDTPAEDIPATGSSAAMALGETGTVGEYTVTVTGVTENANALVQEANEFNDPPTGQYVVLDTTVTYNGTEDGTPWLDLTWTFQGTDARNYSEASCSLGDVDAMQQPDLRQGGSTSYSVCFDAPAEAIAGGTIVAEETLSFSDETISWKLG
ncbi:MAG: DUF4190 domain-containing protein [Actinomycetales bacterium]